MVADETLGRRSDRGRCLVLNRRSGLSVRMGVGSMLGSLAPSPTIGCPAVDGSAKSSVGQLRETGELSKPGTADYITDRLSPGAVEPSGDGDGTERASAADFFGGGPSAANKGANRVYN